MIDVGCNKKVPRKALVYLMVGGVDVWRGARESDDDQEYVLQSICT